MIVCRECGDQNADDSTFCGSCGAFLEWAGEKVAAQAAEQAEPAAEPAEPAHVEPFTLPDAPQQAPPDTRPIAPPTATSQEAHTATPAPEQAPPDARPAAPPAASSQEAHTVTPVPPRSAPPEPELGARTPAREVVRRRPTPVAAETVTAPEPTDVRCRQCGTGNRATSNFCRGCGASLRDAPPLARIPWWRRLFRRKRDTRPAGSRPDPRLADSVGRRPNLSLPRNALLLIALVGAVVAAVGPFRDAVLDRVRAVFADPPRVEVNGARVGGSDGKPLRKPIYAIDGFENTYWEARPTGRGKWQRLVLTFEQPRELDVVGLTVGDPKNFKANPRPRRIRLRYFRPDGRRAGRDSQVVLDDTGKFQHHDIDAEGVVRVVLTIVAVRPIGQSRVAIREVEFFDECWDSCKG